MLKIFAIFAFWGTKQAKGIKKAPFGVKEAYTRTYIY